MITRDNAHRLLDLVRLQLQTAIEIEHTTVPPYLTAAFSIPQATNRDAQANIRGVVMEEMLHMTLAANVLNAVGGSPAIDDPAFIPGYPTNLPWHAKGFSVGLAPFSPEQIDTFCAIETPTPPNADAQAHAPELAALGRRREDAEKVIAALKALDPENPPPWISGGWETIGEFYAVVMGTLVLVTMVLGEDRVFTGDARRQVRPEHYYGGGGEVIVVTDLVSAVHALSTIVVQGEGTSTSVWDGSPEHAMPLEPAHFYAFDEIRRGRFYKVGDEPNHPTGAPLPVAWEAAYPMHPNPKREQYRERAPEIHRQLEAFDALYFRLLHALHDAFNGAPERFRQAVAEMYELKYRAVALMRTPSPVYPGYNVGPSWGSMPGGHHPAHALWRGEHKFFATYPDLAPKKRA